MAICHADPLALLFPESAAPQPDGQHLAHENESLSSFPFALRLVCTIFAQPKGQVLTSRPRLIYDIIERYGKE